MGTVVRQMKRGHTHHSTKEVSTFLRDMFIEVGDMTDPSNPIIVAAVAGVDEKKNAYSQMAELEAAWEYYQENFRQEPYEPTVAGKFGPLGNMQGSDHPLRR